MTKGKSIPPLSVIITVYQAQAYLMHCTKQILRQWQDGMELIIVDDGSSDGTTALCDKVAGENRGVKVIRMAHGGVARARQAGLEAARGEYILYVDADDKVEPTMFADLLQTARKHHADMVLCDYKELTSNGEFYRKQQPSALDGATVLDDILTGKLYGALWNKLLRREWLLQSKARFPESLHMREDLVFLSQCLPSASRIVYLPKALYGYNRRNAQALTQNYLDESPQYYQQESQWLTMILGNNDLKPKTRQQLLEYFSELAYTTLRRRCFSQPQWQKAFTTHPAWALHGKGHKRLLVDMALHGGYGVSSLLRTLIAKRK